MTSPAHAAGRPTPSGSPDAKWRWLTAAAAVIAIAFGSWAVTAQNRLSDTENQAGSTTTVTAPANESAAKMEQLISAPDVEVRHGDDSSGVGGLVIRSKSSKKAMVMMTNLPNLQPGTTFQSWTFHDGNPVSAGTFESADGHASMLLEGDGALTSTVAITVEPTGGSTAPTTDPISKVNLG